MQFCTKAEFNRVVLSSGFGGRGVLPGVATGTDLNPKSSEVKHFLGVNECVHCSIILLSYFFKRVNYFSVFF